MEEKNMMIYLFAFLVLAFGGMYIISNQTKPQNFYLSQEPLKNKITVTGESKTKATPDELQLSFSIETNHTSSAKKAQEKNSEIAEKVKDALLAAGLNKDNFKTTEFSVQPILVSKWYCPDKAYDDQGVVYPPGDCNYYDRIYYTETIGYKATHSIFISSDNTQKAGEYMDAIAGAGSSDVKINEVSFTLKDATKKELEKIFEETGKILKVVEIDYKKNIMASMRWTNEWLNSNDAHKEYLFLVEKIQQKKYNNGEKVNSSSSITRAEKPVMAI